MSSIGSLFSIGNASSIANWQARQAQKTQKSFELDMTQPELNDPAKIAGMAGSATANTLFAAQDIGQSTETASTTNDTKSKASGPAEDRFLDFMNKSPEQMMREAILKELGYSEDDLKNMSPQDRAKAEAEIQERIKIKIEQAMREKGIDPDNRAEPIENSTLGA